MTVIDLPTFDSSFYIDVENLVKDSDISYMDAIIHWCDRNKVDVEHIAPMVTKNPLLKLKLQGEGEKLNFLPKTTRLPI